MPAAAACKLVGCSFEVKISAPLGARDAVAVPDCSGAWLYVGVGMKHLIPVVVVAGVIAALLAPAAAQTEEVTELTVGEWQGGAEAWGTARASGQGTEIEWDARLVSTFTFTVTEGANGGVEGEFSIRSDGLDGGDSMKMRAVTGGISFTADWDIDAGAGGRITGSRSELFFDSRPISTTATISAAGQTLTVAGQPSSIFIANTIEYLACDHAIGIWDVSISQQIEAESWTPSWTGYWAAVPVLDEDSETAEEEFIDGLEELFDDYRAFESAVGTSLGPDADYDPTVIDSESMYGLIARSTELMNRLHNLSACDQEAIGAETLQEWRTALAGVISDLVLVLADRIALQDGLFLSVADLMALVAAADGTNAYRGAGEAFQVEDALAELSSKTIEGHLRLSRGEGGEECNQFCRQREYNWAAGGVAVAVTHGWSVTVEGTTYSPADAPSLLSDPPGGES